jgi:hypothetical protein
VLTPYFRPVFGRLSNYTHTQLLGGQREYSEWLERLGRERDVPVLDLHYCQEISDREALFFDSRHLNGAGAEALGELLGKLYSGERPTPAAWLGTPSRAQHTAMFGQAPPPDAPELATGARHPLSAALGFPQAGKVLDLYARFTLDRAGEWEVVLLDREPSVHGGEYFVQLGPGPFRLVAPPPARAGRWSFGTFELPAGEHGFELHSRTGAPIDWEELLVERAGGP